MNAKDWIDALQLQPHPEGGYFRETYRSAESIAQAHLHPRFAGDRAIATAIYYLLQGDDFSALHRIKQDEIWHFYAGRTLIISAIAPHGELLTSRLGLDVRAGESPQAIVHAGWLFGARLSDPESFALVGCTVAPGFDFADFEVPPRRKLLLRYPQHREVIETLTR